MAYRRRELPAPAPIRYNPRPRPKQRNWKEDLALSAAQTLLKGGRRFGEMAYRDHLQGEAAEKMHGREMARLQEGSRLRGVEADAAERRRREMEKGTWEWEQLQLRRFGGPEDAARTQAEEQAKLDEQFATGQTGFSAKKAEYEQSEGERAKARKAYGDYLTRGISVDLPAVDIDLGDVDVTARGHDPFPHSGAGEDVVPTTVRAPSYTTERKGSEGEQAARRLTSQVQGFFPGQGLAAGEGLDPALRPRAAVPSLTTRKKSPAAPAESIARSAGKVGIGGVKTAKAPAAAPTIPEALDKPVDPVREIAELRETRGQRKVREQRELADLQAETGRLTKEKELIVAKEAKQIGIHADNIKRVGSHYANLSKAMGGGKRFRIKTLERQIALGRKMMPFWTKQGLSGVSDVDAYEALLGQAEERAQEYRAARRALGGKKKAKMVYLAPHGVWPNGSKYATEEEMESYRVDPVVQMQLKNVNNLLMDRNTVRRDTLTGKILYATQVAEGDTTTPQRGLPPLLTEKGGKGSGPAGAVTLADQLLLSQKLTKADRDDLESKRSMALRIQNEAEELELLDANGNFRTEDKNHRLAQSLKDLNREMDDHKRRIKDIGGDLPEAPPPRPTATGAGAGELSGIAPANQAELDKLVAGLRSGKDRALHEKHARLALKAMANSKRPGEYEAVKKILDGELAKAPTPAKKRAPLGDMTAWERLQLSEGHPRGNEARAASGIVRKTLKKAERAKNLLKRQSLIEDAESVLENFRPIAGSVTDGESILGKLLSLVAKHKRGLQRLQRFQAGE